MKFKVGFFPKVDWQFGSGVLGGVLVPLGFLPFAFPPRPRHLRVEGGRGSNGSGNYKILLKLDKIEGVAFLKKSSLNLN